MSDHFKAAGGDKINKNKIDLRVYIIISFLLSGLLTHGVVSDDLAVSTVVSNTFHT